MATRTCRVGIHGRNNVTFEEVDYQALRAAKIEAVKMMGQTEPGVFKRLKKDLPNIDIITRLYDDRIGLDKHPTPQEFAKKQIPLMRAVKRYCVKFEVHNEPNHLHRYEGWGQEDYHAQDFNKWFLQVYDLLKNACPWAKLGFPGLAIPHRDLEWIEICRPAVERADWIGIHCYWQTPPGQEQNHLADFWGLRFKYYYKKFPNKIQEITECGNSNIQADPPIPISDDVLAQQYVEYYQELFKYNYINSACFFMLSSQDPTWDFFSWRGENGRIKPVVNKVGQMSRPPLRPAQAAVITPAVTAPTNGAGGASILLPSLQISDISLRLSRNPAGSYPQRSLSNIQRIIIHHTAVSEKVGPERIAKLQVKNGKPGISYHYFIAEDGTTYQTNALTTVSAHTQGQDQSGVAIAFAGNFTGVIPTQKQLAAGGRLCAALMSQLNISTGNVSGASELIATQSPGKQWLTGQIWKNLLFNKIKQASTTAPIVPPPITTPPATTGNTQITQLNTQIAQLTAQVAQLQAANTTANNQITLLNNQITVLNNQIVQLQSQLTQAQSSAQSAAGSQTQINNLNAQIIQLQGQLIQARQTAQRSLANSQAQITALNNQIIQLRAQLAQAQTGASTPIVDQSGEVAALKERIAELELQLSFSAEAAAGAGTGIAAPVTSGKPIVAQPAIENITASLPRHPANRYTARSTGDIRTIVIHHTAVPATITAARLAKFNVEKNNWPGIGFHYFITGDGKIQQSNDLTTVSYHAGGENPSSVGVAFAGKYDDAPPAEAQIKAGGHLIAWLLSNFNLPQNAVRAHNELADTPCPGRQWDSGSNWKASLTGVIQSYLGGAAQPAVAAPVSGGKAVHHYMLFRQGGQEDLAAASNYINKFQPQTGFSIDEAMTAQFVTIVGGTQSVSDADERRIKAGGSQVERIPGNSPRAIQALLDNMVNTNRQFLQLKIEN